MERERDLTRTWMHIDFEMFYAQVEIRDKKELADKPVAVGGMNMIATANYVARRYGVRSAMPGFIAQQLCPELVMIPPNFTKYKSVAQIFREIVAEYDPDYVTLGLDEVNLDVTDFLSRHDLDTHEGRHELAETIRARVFEAT